MSILRRKLKRFFLKIKRNIFTREVRSINEIDCDTFVAIVYYDGWFSFYDHSKNWNSFRPKFKIQEIFLEEFLIERGGAVYYEAKPRLINESLSEIPDQLFVITNWDGSMYRLPR